MIWMSKCLMESMSNRILFSVLGVLFLSGFAQATPIVYTDATAWAAATSNVTTVTFNEVTTNEYFGSGYTSGDLTVTGSGGYLFGWHGQDFGTGFYLIGSGSQGATVSETFGGEQQAASTDLGIYAASGTLGYDFTTHLGDNISGSVSISDGTLSFIGLVADPGDWVTNLTITMETPGLGSGYGNIIVDNAAYGDAAPEGTVPEPGSLALLGSGMVGLASYLRRRFHTA